MPGCHVGEARTNHLMLIVDHYNAPFGHLDVRGLLEYGYDFRLVIVACIDVAADATSAQAFFGDSTPAFDALNHQASEKTINEAAVSFHGGKFFQCCAIWIGPSVTYLAFEGDRKSTRLNSSHLVISYAVFCLKKKKKRINVIFNDSTLKRYAD